MNPGSLDGKMAAIVRRLAAGQQADGGFRMMRRFSGEVEAYVTPTEFPGWYEFGACPFATANIAIHLCGIELPQVAEIRRKACESLAARLENGVARYIPPDSKPVALPADVDDTCLAAAALRANGLKPACNTAMVLANTGGDGAVYTWLVPRRRHLRHPANFLWLLRDRRRWRGCMAGWPEGQIERMVKEYIESSEPAVAANVVLFFGVTRRTRPIVDRLIRCVLDDNVPLGYYSNRIAAYFHIARLYHSGVRQVVPLRTKIADYLCRMQEPDGAIEGPFNTACAALCLMYFECWGWPQLDAALRYLAAHEMHECGWQPLHYCNGLAGGFVDGSPELTATLYLEALYRYRRHGGAE